MKNNICIITAKGNNTTLKNKNLIKIGKHLSMEWQIRAAQKSKLIDEIYVTTEDDKIKNVALENNVKVIDRPLQLSQPDSNHSDVIEHAILSIGKKHATIDTVTILLGNTVMVSEDDIDNNINKLLNDHNADSAMTVWVAQDDHPLRAMKINKLGYLESYLNVENLSSNRQSYEKVVFYDQGPWTLKYENYLKNYKLKIGPGPWNWMGKNSIPVERVWVTGRDTHTDFDLNISEWFIKNYK